MRREQIIDLVECTEFRQTLQARPPRIVHGTLTLLVLLLGGAMVWSCVTPANLVVRAPGRVRPVSTPTGVFATFGTRIDGRVVEVNYREGEPVREGQLLIRLDTEHLDNDIARQTRVIETLETELSRQSELQELRRLQFEAGKAKAEAELDGAVAEVDRARAQRVVAIRQADVDLAAAEQRLTRNRELFERQALSRAEMIDAETAFEQAREKLAEAELPVDDAAVHIARRTLDLVEQEYAAQRSELEINRVAREGDLDAARRELAGLELEREQSVLRAPLDGVVITQAVKVGDVLERGRPALQIAPQSGFHFEAAVPSGEVGHLQPGMPARIKFDAYDYQEYGTLEGTVCFISPDSRLPEEDQQHAPVYIVEIELNGEVLQRDRRQGEVKLGMAGQAEIITGQESLLALLVKQIRQTISLG